MRVNLRADRPAPTRRIKIVLVLVLVLVLEKRGWGIRVFEHCALTELHPRGGLGSPEGQ